MQGVPMYPTHRGFLLVPHPATGRCSPGEVIDLVNADSSPATRRCSPVEVIDLMSDDSSAGTPVNQVATKQRTLVIVIMDDDVFGDSSTIEIEDSSLGSQVSDGNLKGIDDWETLTDTFDSETSNSVAVPHFDNGSVIVTPGERLVCGTAVHYHIWILDGLKDCEIPTEFGDDDISAIVAQADTEATAVDPAPQESIDANSLFGRAK